MTRPALLLVLAVPAALSGCDFDPAAMNAKLTTLDAQVAKLEAACRYSACRAYPRASAYFASKDECAASAAQWSFPNDKSAKLVSADPWITQSVRKDQ